MIIAQEKSSPENRQVFKSPLAAMIAFSINVGQLCSALNGEKINNTSFGIEKGFLLCQSTLEALKLCSNKDERTLLLNAIKEDKINTIRSIAVSEIIQNNGGPVSAYDIADFLGIAHMTVYRHLKSFRAEMERKGTVDSFIKNVTEMASRRGSTKIRIKSTTKITIQEEVVYG